jgi:hypothetical protein
MKKNESAEQLDCQRVFDSIESWKKRLLDLTRRNGLLFLTESSARDALSYWINSHFLTYRKYASTISSPVSGTVPQ